MAKFHTSKNSEGMCEKIRNATLSPVFRKIRSISVRPQNSTPTNTTPKFALPTTNPTSIEIPIESSPQLFPTRLSEKGKNPKPHAPKNGQVIQVAIVTPKNEAKTRGPLPGEQLIKPKVDAASPLKAVSIKEKATQDKEEGSRKAGQDDINSMSSDYIDRVKNKMRAKSNVDDEKHVPRRDSFNDKVSNYIIRAKVKLRTTSSIGGGT